MATFMEGFLEGVGPGLAYAKGRQELRKSNASQRLAQLLGEGENFDPGAGTFDAAAQGVPEAGQQVQKPNRGYDGRDFANLENQFFKEASYLPDLGAYSDAKKLWAEMKAGRIQEGVAQALQAYDRGDMGGAAQLLSGVSAFMSPGTTPEISVDPKSGAFVIANYDEKGNPIGGYAMTRDQVADIASMMDWKTYADREQQQRNVDRDYALALEKWGVQEAYYNQQFVFGQNDEQRKQTMHNLDVANANLDQQTKIFNLDKAVSEDVRAKNDIATEFVSQLITSSSKQAEANRAAMPAGGGYSSVTHPLLLDQESGNNFGVRPSKQGARGRAQFMPARFAEAQAAGAVPAGMTFEEFGTDTPAGRAAQLSAEEWHWGNIRQFIQQNGLQNYIGKLDPNGTPITQYGLEFAAHILGNQGLVDYLRGNTSKKDANSMGGKQYMKLGLQATGEDPTMAAGGAGIPGGVDELLAPTGSDSSSTTKDTMVPNPWYMTEPDETGAVYPRQMLASMEALGQDILEHDPDANPREVGLMEVSAFGPEEKVRIEADPEDTEIAYISNGVSKHVISADMAGMILDYQDDVRGRREAIGPPQSYFPPQAPQEAPPQGGIPVPAGASGGSGLPNPAVAPGAAAAPRAAAPAAATAPGAAAAATALPGAIPTPELMPPLVDDTAVRMQ